MRIACLEDDVTQAELVRQIIVDEGHECDVFHEGRSLIRQLRRERFDMLLLDWQLPDMTGYEVTAWVRAYVGERIPVLFITSRALEEDIVAGLVVGADDYMVKPVRRAELVARMNALFRRNQSATDAAHEVIEAGHYRIDVPGRTFYLRGEPVALTCREFDLALLLFRHIRRVLSREHIGGEIWGQAPDSLSRTVDTHMSRVRNKLQLYPQNGVRLTPIYGYGYRLDALADTDTQVAAT